MSAPGIGKGLPPPYSPFGGDRHLPHHGCRWKCARGSRWCAPGLSWWIRHDQPRSYSDSQRLVGQQLATARNWAHTHIYIYIYVKIHEVENSDWLTNYPKYEWILAIGYKSFSTPFKSKTSSRRYWNILGIYLSNFMCIYYMCPHMYVQYKSVYMHMYIMHTHAELHITPNHSWDTCDHFLVAETAAKWRAPCKPQRHIKHCNLGKRGVISKWS